MLERCFVQANSQVHHFGNTATGFKYHTSGSVLHLVNEATVASLGQVAGVALDASRFRPNVVLHGVPAWSEFEWLGRTISVGDATLEVLTRTVRCEATNVDARHGSGKADLDVPGLLSKHFPEHGPYLGVYARVVRSGHVHVGDTLTVSGKAVQAGGQAAERRADVVAALLANGLSKPVRAAIAMAVVGALLAAAAFRIA